MSTQEREVHFVVEQRVAPGGRWRAVTGPRKEEPAFQERNRLRGLGRANIEYRVVKESIEREVIG